MAYKTAELEKKALKAIEENKCLFFINDLIAFLPCSQSTFYDHKLEESESIKEALEQNKINAKVGLRNKWYESDNATTQIALYKLIGTDAEVDRITSQRIDHTNNGNSFNTLSDDDIITRVAKLIASEQKG